MELITTMAVSAATGAAGWIVTRYLILPSKVEGLADDVKYLRDKVDQLFAHLIQR